VNGIVDVTAVFEPVQDEEDSGATVQSTPTTTDDKYSSKPGG
jgi:hypothetical protein